MKKYLTFFFLQIFFLFNASSQNVGVGTATPESKLHIKGSADVTQFIIDANTIQNNINPLLKLRNSAGVDLMWIHSDNQSNTFVGYNTGKANISSSTGINNTFLGNNAGALNTLGNANTATGVYALSNNTTGYSNCAYGAGSLANNISGIFNSAYGGNSLGNNTTGTDNVAVGLNSLGLNSTGSQNVAIGSGALANGSYSNGGTAWSSANVGIGINTLFTLNATSTSNAARNTAIGGTSMFNSTTATENSTVGYGTMYANTSGSFNACMGKSALSSLTTGNNNVAIGTNALNNLIGGSSNIAIGAGAGTASGSPNVTNTISIGNIGFLNAASNQAFIGNFSTAYNGGNVTWSVFSDARIKRNITEDVKGLNFILKLRPVTYYRSIKKAIAITGNNETPDYAGKYDIEKRKESGFLAQEVEKAAKDAGYDFSGVNIPVKSNQLYTLSYEQFVVPLVKAVQEQQQMIKYQQQEIDVLNKQNEKLATMQSDIKALKSVNRQHNLD